MRVVFSQDGGVAYFPALNQPVMLDSRDLPAEESDQLQSLVEQAGILNEPEDTADLRNAELAGADQLRYTVTVEVDSQRHTVVLTDPVTDPFQQELIDYLSAARSSGIAKPGNFSAKTSSKRYTH